MNRTCYVIAEAGVNHNGSIDLAHKLVDVAKAAGADAVKFQTFDAATLVTEVADKAKYQKENTASGGTQLEMLRKLELSSAQFRELFDHCKEIGIDFMSTPFDEASADFLAEMGMTIFKIPSGEVTNPLLLKHVAKLGGHVILSTGMCNLAEVERAVHWITGVNDRELWILHCVSAYPAPLEEVNLRAMASMEHAFGCPVGLSDHTQGTDIPIAAAALGAVCIEKHYTLDRTMAGPDHAASLEPDELESMMKAIRGVHLALGDGIKRRTASEEDTARVARRSIVLAGALAEGHILVEGDLRLKRPGTGLSPELLGIVLGMRLRRSLPADTLLALSDLS